MSNKTTILQYQNVSSSTNSIENEVDGEAFLILTDEQLQLLVKAIGAQMKLDSLQAPAH